MSRDISDRGVCPGSFVPALVPGQKNTRTRIFCPGTKGQRDVPSHENPHYPIISYLRGNDSCLNLEIVANLNSCHNISIFYLMNWIFAMETIQGRKLWGNTVLYYLHTQNKCTAGNFFEICLKVKKGEKIIMIIHIPSSISLIKLVYWIISL